MSNPRKISVVIRTYNEAEHLGRLLEVLNGQILSNQDTLEIIVVDSESTDATVDIAKRYGVKLIEIPKAEFNYSKSLNLGIENSIGDLIVILSAHSIPTDNNWLAGMLKNFKDEEVAGVYCKQIPWPDAPWREIDRISSIFPDKACVFSVEDKDFELSFSNAASCIRRDLWEKHNFKIMPASEDREWAKWAIDNGYKIIYYSSVSVCHSHKDDPKKLAQRIIEIEQAKDAKLNISRTKWLTIKQGIGWLCRDTRKIFNLRCTMGQKIKAFIEQIKSSFWFILSFNKNND